MPPIDRFEDLIAWQKAREFVATVYRLTERGALAKDFGLKDQIRRAAVSVMTNIAEGFEHHRFTEFHQFLSIAKASCGECRSLLYVAADAGYLSEKEFKWLHSEAAELVRILGGLRSAVAKTSRREKS